MPNYWILCISEDNFEISIKHQMIGMGERRKRVIEQMEIGDLIAFYIPKKNIDSPPMNKVHQVRCFKGIAKITGPAFESNDVIWKVRGSDIFPYRRKVEFLNTEMNVPIKPLINKFSFVKNTAYWGIAFQKGYTQITEQDFELIQEAVKS
ncbi:EVE domain-containing protein [bacterium]|nr:EVE domain-containing protein [bacterium]